MTQKAVKIDCYLSEHCGSYHELRENITQAVAELSLQANVAFHTIYYDNAVAMDIKGSPTVRVDGRDLFEISGTPGITWRTYQDGSGRLKRVPSVEMIKTALKERIP